MIGERHLVERPIRLGQVVKFFYTLDDGVMEGRVTGVYPIGDGKAKLQGESWAVIEIQVAGEKKPRTVYSADVAETEGKLLEIIARQL